MYESGGLGLRVYGLDLLFPHGVAGGEGLWATQSPSDPSSSSAEEDFPSTPPISPKCFMSWLPHNTSNFILTEVSTTVQSKKQTNRRLLCVKPLRQYARCLEQSPKKCAFTVIPSRAQKPILPYRVWATVYIKVTWEPTQKRRSYVFKQIRKDRKHRGRLTIKQEPAFCQITINRWGHLSLCCILYIPFLPVECDSSQSETVFPETTRGR